MGLEILWFRHVTLLLGGFRAVFSLLLTVILIGMGAGSLLGGALVRRTARPAQWLMIVQCLFVATTLLGLSSAGLRPLVDAGAVAAESPGADPGLARGLSELWFNARTILLEVGVTSVLMGLAFPVANAMVLRAEATVGRHTGLLYLSNTAGAVCGSIATGFFLLPLLGMQNSATVLMIVAAAAIVPLATVAQGFPPSLRYGEARRSAERGGGSPAPGRRKAEALRYRIVAAAVVSLLISGAAIGLWLQLPSGSLIAKATAPRLDRRHRSTTRSPNSGRRCDCSPASPRHSATSRWRCGGPTA
jgi:MFS family permease